MHGEKKRSRKKKHRGYTWGIFLLYDRLQVICERLDWGKVNCGSAMVPDRHISQPQIYLPSYLCRVGDNLVKQINIYIADDGMFIKWVFWTFSNCLEVKVRARGKINNLNTLSFVLLFIFFEVGERSFIHAAWRQTYKWQHWNKSMCNSLPEHKNAAIGDILTSDWTLSQKKIWRNLALHHLPTNGSSAVNGCRQNESPNSW